MINTKKNVMSKDYGCLLIAILMFLPWINDPELLKLRDRLQIC